MYIAFQARPASPVGVQPNSGMGHDILEPVVKTPRLEGVGATLGGANNIEPRAGPHLPVTI
ncbi:hypothetical protein DSO57_1009742 [Entomophthora muscae]|uniref:Uncharacterized protein n=1 Tax=Entomophthora muscae TaxID=34485 RepID=A0ACC2URR0_9FUNG|nr:hypothetical protein DSO57_1009742 [Entomophthora muscae]